jgi:molybdopterin-guanine dinucleotide biosynthesis protein B
VTAPRALAIGDDAGAGKTTLIEQLIPELAALGWRVAVLKRTHHPVVVDVAGKDSDRFFRAGATVCLQAPGQVFVRQAIALADADRARQQALAELAAAHDVVLVEGHKETPLPKVWLLGPDEAAPPPGVSNLLAVLGRDPPRLAITLALCLDLAAPRRRCAGARR